MKILISPVGFVADARARGALTAAKATGPGRQLSLWMDIVGVLLRSLAGCPGCHPQAARAARVASGHCDI